MTKKQTDEKRFVVVTTDSTRRAEIVTVLAYEEQEASDGK